MFSRFFIDRPIFATVMSVIITLTGVIALRYLPVAQYPRITPPSVQVSMSYPGASAQVVADTVVAPVEQQVNGIEGMLYMSSQSSNDGTYTLTVTFDISTDLNTAVVIVQNRVAQAMSQLPSAVQNQGITIRKKTPDILMMVSFFSPDGSKDDIYLSNYATVNVKDELLRVDGVSDINYLGQRDYSIRVWLDPQKLAARNMTALDVANAIRAQNVDAPAGRIGQPPIKEGQAFQLPLDTLGRLTDPEQFADIIVKVGGPPPILPTAGLGMAGSAGHGQTMVQSPSASILSGVSTSGGATTGGGGSSAGGGTTGGGGTGTLTDTGLTAGGASSGVMAGALNGITFTGGPPASSSPLVRLSEVARVERGAQNYNLSCSFDGKPSVGLSVYQLPGTNALDVADRVRAKMEELKTHFPEGLDYAIAYDTTPFIRESVTDVLKTLVEAVLVVGLVVLVFLQDWRAMILPMIDVPVSLIGTFAVMAVLGFSLNNISLFGLVLAIGIVVDDAIVVLENIERQMALGLEARAATIKAMEEVTGPIIAVGLVLCAVFLPCLFIKGITGQFFRQFAVTISVSTAISAINALTMTPSRAVLIFKSQQGQAAHEHRREALPWWIFAFVGGLLSIGAGHRWLESIDTALPLDFRNSGFFSLETAVLFIPGALAGGLMGWFIIGPVNGVLGWLFRGFNRGFDGLTNGYGWSIGTLLRRSAVMLVVYAGLLFLTAYVFQKAPTGFIPQQDQGRLIVSIQLPDSASLERTRDAVAQIDRIAHETPGIAHTVAFAGSSFLLQANSPNFASMFIVLAPFPERQQPGLRDTDIMAKLRQAWREQVKEAQATVFGASPVPGLGVAGGFKFLVEDRGGLGVQALQRQTDDLIRRIQELPGMNSATTQFRSNTPQLYLDIDRVKAASLGVSVDDVNQTLDMFLGSLYVNSFNDFTRHWQVTIQADQQFRYRAANINLFQVRNSLGQMVPLSTLVHKREIGGPIAIPRYNLHPAAAVNGNVAPGASTGDAIKAINQLGDAMPLSTGLEWTELMFMQIRAGNTAIFVFALAVISVFLALAALYESWSLPLAVILVVPLCLLCSVAGVQYTSRDVNIFVQIGLVVLVGLACKNAILIVEFAKQLQNRGDPCFAATQEASRLRLRPILMTSFAFILGVVPLVVASGAGAEMRRSLGIAVFSGMLGVTLFGIFLTPVFYYVIQGLGESRLFHTKSVQAAGTYLLGGLLSAATGSLLAEVEVGNRLAGPLVGAFTGLIAVWAVREVHQKIKL